MDELKKQAVRQLLDKRYYKREKNVIRALELVANVAMTISFLILILYYKTLLGLFFLGLALGLQHVARLKVKALLKRAINLS